MPQKKVRNNSLFSWKFRSGLSMWVLGVGWCLYLSWKSTPGAHFQFKHRHQPHDLYGKCAVYVSSVSDYYDITNYAQGVTQSQFWFDLQKKKINIYFRKNIYISFRTKLYFSSCELWPLVRWPKFDHGEDHVKWLDGFLLFLKALLTC